LQSGGYTQLLADGVNYTWTSATQVQLSAAPVVGQTLSIRRETPTTSRLVDWNDGSALTADALDTADLQNFYAIQEHKDYIEVLGINPNTNVTDGSITANKLSSDAVTTIKIQDGAVTSGKIQDGAIVNADVNASAGIVASKLSFTQSGAGAVTRTVDSKLKDVVSVKDFGAVGDGVADDAAAVQAAIDTVETLGGSVLFPPGKYLFGSQVTINRTGAPLGGGFVGERNLLISGYGAEIRTSGAISAFDVRGGFQPYQSRIEGFTIYHRNNTQAVAGIRMIGASLVTCSDVSVVVSGSLPAGYAAFSLENLTPSDPDSGCFWCRIERCSVRPWGGAEGFGAYGVKATGAANALTLQGNVFSGATTHVWLGPHAGQAYMPNAVVIDGNFFEAPAAATGIELNGGAVIYHVSGTRITNNRFEGLTNAATFTGTGTTVQLPAYFAGNYADTSVTNYIVNSLSIPVVMLDFVGVGSPMGPAKMYNKEGLIIDNWDGTFDTLTVGISALGKGLRLRRNSDGAVLGSLAYSNAAGGIGMQLAGSYSPSYRPLTIKGCQGIAARDTAANNLASTATFAASTQRVVTLPVAEADANYLIFLEARANQRLWVSARSTTTFTVDSDVSSSNSFGWLLIRHQ
jgi:hypothetical protein